MKLFEWHALEMERALKKKGELQALLLSVENRLARLEEIDVSSKKWVDKNGKIISIGG